MAADQNVPDGESIPMENSEPTPVPVPAPADASQESSPPPVPVPVPVPVPPPSKQDDDEPIALVDDFEHVSSVHHTGEDKISSLGFEKKEFKRPLNANGSGATRCRMFKSKIAEGPLEHLEVMINEWLDSEEIEIKHVNQCIGTLEGKRAVENLFIFVWY
ncbi:MAG: hypothetical protein K8S55_09830 [Phycisphaerae bacterium]|nr:hypothetical protein [Phycisphaerae bacterium]